VNEHGPTEAEIEEEVERRLLVRMARQEQRTVARETHPWSFWRAVGAIYVALLLAGITGGVVSYAVARYAANEVANNINEEIERLQTDSESDTADDEGPTDPNSPYAECITDPDTKFAECQDLPRN